jgi:hypothetical protein
MKYDDKTNNYEDCIEVRKYCDGYKLFVKLTGS